MQISSNFNQYIVSKSRRLIRGLFCFSVAVVLVFSSLAIVELVEADDSALLIESSWIREVPPGVPTLAAYLNITNITNSPVSIIGVSSSVADISELHEVKMENEVMQMRKMSAVIIQPGETLELKAGGSHVMLMGVQESFVEGDEIDIEFELKNLPTVKVMVPVRKDS